MAENHAAVAGQGRLNGLTILRYAHVSGNAGGLEQYLFNLNRALGERNQFTGVQMEITDRREQLQESFEQFGGCNLTKIPLLVEADSLAESMSGKTASCKNKLKSWLVERGLCAAPVYALFTRHYLKRRRVPRRPGEPAAAGEEFSKLARRFKIDLVILHSSGGADASEIILAAKRANIPTALVYHFSNDRLAGLSLRQQAADLDGVAGVYGGDVPKYLRARFTNVSDGVDTDFFQVERAGKLPQKFFGPVLFLPARITRTKGQTDVLKVAGLLKKRGVAVTVAFAGRVDSPEFECELRALSAKEGLGDAVQFVGQLNSAQLRDWYAAARVLVFPTRHHEGLPRILMECQAMGLPPVVYDIGGTPEGLVDGRTGFLIPSGNVPAMADAVARLISDDALHSDVAQAGRRLVEEKFSLPSLAKRHEDFCLKVLATHRNRPPVNFK